MSEGYFQRVQKMTVTRFWINNVTRNEADRSIAAGAVGCTQNPSYVWKMLTNEEERGFAEAQLRKILAATADDNEALILLQQELVSGIAKKFLPLFESSGGKEGYVSIQGDPFDESYDTIMRLARMNRACGPNIMIKIPVTEHGLSAIHQCILEGMPVNATEVMSLSQALDVCDAYDDATRGMKKPPIVFLSHIAGIFDEYLSGSDCTKTPEASRDVLFQAGKAVAKKIREYMNERKTNVGFINGGARGLHHFTEWVGADIAVTINWKGTAEELLNIDPPVVSRFDCPIPASVIDALCTIPEFRKAYYPEGLAPSEYESFGPVVLFCSSFRTAWQNALSRIREIRTL